MTDQNNVSGTQAQAGSESKIDQKMIEEVLASNKELKSQVNSLTEELVRERRVNELINSAETNPSSYQTEDQFASMEDYGLQFPSDEHRKKFESYVQARDQAIYQKVGSLVETKIAQRESARTNEERFYKKYPDLKEYQRDVQYFAGRVQAKYGAKAQYMDKDALLEEVAKETKGYLADLKKKLTKSPVHIEGGSMSEPDAPTREEGPKSTSEEERGADYFAKEVAAMNKRKTTPVY